AIGASRHIRFLETGENSEKCTPTSITIPAIRRDGYVTSSLDGCPHAARLGHPLPRGRGFENGTRSVPTTIGDQCCQIWSQACIQSFPVLTTVSGSTISTPWRPRKSATLSTVSTSILMAVGREGT